MKEREVFQALFDGKTIEKVYRSMSSSLFKIEDNILKLKCVSGGLFSKVSVSSIFIGDKTLKIYKEKKIIVIDGKEIEISEESYNELKRSLT